MGEKMKRSVLGLGLLFCACSAPSAESAALGFVRAVQGGEGERAIALLCPAAREQLAAAAVRAKSTPSALIAQLARVDTARTIVSSKLVKEGETQRVHIGFATGPEQKITLRRPEGRRWCVSMGN
jgi:hypothetical protein